MGMCVPWAHPRACGENFRHLTTHGGAEGSSPRVRGKLVSATGFCWDVGLIPARAGKTTACSWTSATPTGSSPRVRGKPRAHTRDLVRDRLIPARAGKTRFGDVYVPATAAHPRACGKTPVINGDVDVTQAHPRACGEN